MIDNFIKQTARDYDMDESQVREIYDRWHEWPILFYEKLEGFIKQRSN